MSSVKQCKNHCRRKSKVFKQMLNHAEKDGPLEDA